MRGQTLTLGILALPIVGSAGALFFRVNARNAEALLAASVRWPRPSLP